MHPNIPDLKETHIKVISRRIGLMIMALIAPELVVAWAVTQWITANKLANKYRSESVNAAKI